MVAQLGNRRNPFRSDIHFLSVGSVGVDGLRPAGDADRRTERGDDLVAQLSVGVTDARRVRVGRHRSRRSRHPFRRHRQL